MKKLVIAAILFIAATFSGSAQKYALIDMEYILKNIPAYEMATEQLNQVSTKWQVEVEGQSKAAKEMYKKYQSEMVFLSDEMKTKREEEIVKKEKEVAELQRKYFGQEGELFKKRESLMKPIQEDIYNAVKAISEEKAYMMVIDRASASNIIFASPKIDISNDVLSKLGISK
ncbi:MAG: OmpH family outer membrane protein [Bacteroidales bacterium]|nr:OmpH family outer membrane protein [Bacteroidales bacterium]